MRNFFLPVAPTCTADAVGIFKATAECARKYQAARKIKPDFIITGETTMTGPCQHKPPYFQNDAEGAFLGQVVRYSIGTYLFCFKLSKTRFT